MTYSRVEKLKVGRRKGVMRPRDGVGRYGGDRLVRIGKRNREHEFLSQRAEKSVNQWKAKAFKCTTEEEGPTRRVEDHS